MLLPNYLCLFLPISSFIVYLLLFISPGKAPASPARAKVLLSGRMKRPGLNLDDLSADGANEGADDRLHGLDGAG